MHPVAPLASTVPQDQAEGLRQRFARPALRFVPLVSNPHVVFGGVMIERLCTALAEMGLHALVVDAAERSPLPHELALLDLAEGIETLAPQMSYLAARGLPLRHVDTHGSSAGFLQALADAAPRADVAIVHASASDLVRMFARRAVRPLLLASDHPESVTHAYGALKLLALRGGLMTHDLLLAVAPHSPRAERIAPHLARCADGFIGAALHDCVQLDPACDAAEPAPAALHRLLRELLAANESASQPASTGLPGWTLN